MTEKSSNNSQVHQLRIQTIEEWQSIVDLVLRSEPKVILLTGNLGAGKTTFTQYLAKSLGSNNDVTSPTFSIVNVYEIPDGILYHMDLYRLESYDELFNAGIEEYFFEDKAICIVEWPDLIMDTDLTVNAVQVEIDVHDGERKVYVIVQP